MVDPTGECADTCVDVGVTAADGYRTGYYSVMAIYYQTRANNESDQTKKQEYQNKANEYEQKATDAVKDYGADMLGLAVPGVSSITTREARVAYQTSKAVVKSEARELAEKLAKKEALSHVKDARVIMGVGTNKPLGDSKYKVGWQKMEYIHRTANGENIVVHFMKEVRTGKIEQVKVK